MREVDEHEVKQDEGRISPEKNFYLDVPPKKSEFYVKGMDNVDWGMKDRLAHIFNPKSGNTVMLAFDHGGNLGAITGLERMDIIIPQLAEEIDVFMATRGALRSCVPPTYQKAVALRCTGGTTILRDDIIDDIVGVDIEEAIRMNASCMAIQTFVGTRRETESLEALMKVVNIGNRYNIPTLGVVAVGKQMARTPKFFSVATRVLAECGAQIIKTYYCDDFEKIVAGCPVPIVIAGGKTLPPAQALELAEKAITEGARGVDMGRNIFQAESPKAMAKAIAKVVHEKYTAKAAYEFYLDELNK